MDHIFGIAGGIVSIVGALALAFDLFSTKTEEFSVADFKHLTEPIDRDFDKLTVSLNGHIATVARFLAKYLKLLEEDLPRAGESNEIRKRIIAEFEEKNKKLIGPEKVKEAHSLINRRRDIVEAQFVTAVKQFHRRRRVAIAGVLLVCFGASLQVVDNLAENYAETNEITEHIKHSANRCLVPAAFVSILCQRAW